MNVKDIKVLVICYRILPEFHRIGIPSEYCWTTDELIYVIQNNSQYRIIFVCKSEDISTLDTILRSKHIYQRYIFGNCTNFDKKNEKITIINTDERDLMLDIMCSIIDCIHDEEIRQRESGCHQIADERAKEMLHLFDVVETLYFKNTLKLKF